MGMMGRRKYATMCASCDSREGDGLSGEHSGREHSAWQGMGWCKGRERQISRYVDDTTKNTEHRTPDTEHQTPYTKRALQNASTYPPSSIFVRSMRGTGECHLQEHAERGNMEHGT